MQKKDFKLKKKTHWNNVLLNCLGNVFFSYCLIVAAALLLFSSVMLECTVLGESMLPTLNMKEKKVGSDIVYVNTLYNDYSYGDIIVIETGGKDPIIKRVIGLPGDVIDVVGSDQNGYNLEINGKLIEENYLNIKHSIPNVNLQDGMDMCYQRFQDLKTNHSELFVDDKLVVPHNEIFALGDNRHVSKDSTYYGTFKFENIFGIIENVRSAGTTQFQFYWDYLISGKFIITLANCF